MKVGDELRVKNSLGYMKIKILENIEQTHNKQIGNEYGTLGDFKKLRVEFYKEGYITLYSSERAKEIYLIIPSFDYNDLKVYKCEILHDEKPEYDLNRIEV